MVIDKNTRPAREAFFQVSVPALQLGSELFAWMTVAQAMGFTGDDDVITVWEDLDGQLIPHDVKAIDVRAMKEA